MFDSVCPTNSAFVQGACLFPEVEHVMKWSMFTSSRSSMLPSHRRPPFYQMLLWLLEDMLQGFQRSVIVIFSAPNYKGTLVCTPANDCSPLISLIASHRLPYRYFWAKRNINGGACSLSFLARMSPWATNDTKTQRLILESSKLRISSGSVVWQRPSQFEQQRHNAGTPWRWDDGSGQLFFFKKSSLCTYVSATAKNRKDWNKTHRWQERTCYSYLPCVETALSNFNAPTTVSATAKLTTSTIVVKKVSLQAIICSKLCLSTRKACPPQKKVLCSGCEWEGVVVGDEAPLGGVAQVVSHGVKVVGVHGEEGKEKDGEVPEDVKGEVEQLREKRSSWMVWGWNDGLKDDLSQCGCDAWLWQRTLNSVQACSVLHVAHVLVGVRRVTVVHIGHEDVVVVIHFCVAILFVIFCIRRCSLYTPRRWQ